MSVVTVTGLDRFGIVYDRPSHTLPPEVFSAGANVRFREGGVERFEGHTTVYDPPTIAPKWLSWYPTVNNPHWVYANDTKVYAVNQSTHSNITRQAAGVDVDYNLSTGIRWSSSYLNGIGILSNPNDIPQMWTTIDTTTKLQDLTAWPTLQRAKVIRSFKVFLIALGVTLEDGTELPSSIMWSGPAELNQPPVSWDYADPTTLAGMKHIAESGDEFVDALKMGDLLILYKQNSTYALQFTPSSAVFNDYRILDDVGLIHQDCVVSTPKGHVVLTTDDLVIHRGQRGTEQSLISDRQRRWLFSALDNTNYRSSFLTLNPTKQEVLVCFPLAGSTYCNMALVWNWETGSVGFRDLPDVPFGSTGTFVQIAEDATWDGDTGSWNDDSDIWGEGGLEKALRYPVFADFTNSTFYRLGGSNTFNGTNFTSFVERTGLTIVGQDRNGVPVVDASKIKFVSALYPNFEAEAGTEIVIQVGGQMELSDPITWSEPQTFVVGEDFMIGVTISARYLAVRFQNDDNKPWKLNSYGLDIQIVGKY